MGYGIIAAVSFGVGRVAKEYESYRARCDLMGRSSGDARVVETAEDVKVSIGGWGTKNKMVRCKVAASAARANVKEKGCGGEGVRLEARKLIGMKEKRTHAIVKSAKDAFSSTVLLQNVGESEMKYRAMCGEESTNNQVVELLPIVCLERKNETPKLRRDVGVKGNKGGDGVRLVPQ